MQGLLRLIGFLSVFSFLCSPLAAFAEQNDLISFPIAGGRVDVQSGNYQVLLDNYLHTAVLPSKDALDRVFDFDLKTPLLLGNCYDSANPENPTTVAGLAVLERKTGGWIAFYKDSLDKEKKKIRLEEWEQHRWDGNIDGSTGVFVGLLNNAENAVWDEKTLTTRILKTGQVFHLRQLDSFLLVEAETQNQVTSICQFRYLTGEKPQWGATYPEPDGYSVTYTYIPPVNPTPANPAGGDDSIRIRTTECRDDFCEGIKMACIAMHGGPAESCMRIGGF